MDLLKFCAKTDPRTYLLNPVRTSRGLIASNGQIIVCIPDNGRVLPDAEEKNVKLLERCLDRYQASGVAVVVSEIALPEAVPCKTCKGKGVTYTEECGDCDGDGEFFHGSHWYHCKDCDGSGKIESSKGAEEICWSCDGSGQSMVVVHVADSGFQRKYLQLLQELPNCKLHVNGYKAAVFEFDGGSGILMPCRD